MILLLFSNRSNEILTTQVTWLIIFKYKGELKYSRVSITDFYHNVRKDKPLSIPFLLVYKNENFKLISGFMNNFYLFETMIRIGSSYYIYI